MSDVTVILDRIEFSIEMARRMIERMHIFEMATLEAIAQLWDGVDQVSMKRTAHNAWSRIEAGGMIKPPHAELPWLERNGRRHSDLRIDDVTAEGAFDLLEQPFTQMWIKIRSDYGPGVDLTSSGGYLTLRVLTDGVIDDAELIDDLEAIAREYVEVPPAPPEPAPVEWAPFRVFIGHGGDEQWRTLRDELRDHHGFEIVAFERGPRAGHTISDILLRMSFESMFAVLVMTGADRMDGGQVRARQNVVHELGYFQGRFGWPNAIALVEEGVDLFSNLDGTQQIRFPKGQIKAAVGELVATLNERKQSLRRPISHMH